MIDTLQRCCSLKPLVIHITSVESHLIPQEKGGISFPLYSTSFQRKELRVHTQEPAWKSNPGEGKMNCMFLSEGDEPDTVNVKLVVKKPGCDPWIGTVVVHSTLERVRQAAAALEPQWVQARGDDKDGVYTAKRYMPIPGCIEVVAWRLIHTDVNGDGSVFKIEDSLKVQKLT